MLFNFTEVNGENIENINGFDRIKVNRIIPT